MRHGSLKALEIDNNDEGGAVVPFGDRSSLSSAKSMRSLHGERRKQQKALTYMKNQMEQKESIKDYI